MRVLSLHNFAKYGCFISINDKIINNIYFDGGVFSQIFDATKRQNYGRDPKKSFDVKWWHGPPLSPCKIWCKSLDARRRERMKCNVFHFFLKITLVGRRPLWCVVELLQKDIASAFLGRFKWYLQPFLRKKSPFQSIEQFSKFSLGGTMFGAQMAGKKLKIWDNGCKVCAHHFDHLEARWKKISTTPFYPMYCRCALV